MASTTNADPMRSKNTYNSVYRQHLTPLDLSSEDISGEENKLKADKDEGKTQLSRKNFKYFLVKPHIFHNNKRIQRSLKPGDIRNSVDSMSALDLPRRALNLGVN